MFLSYTELFTGQWIQIHGKTEPVDGPNHIWQALTSSPPSISVWDGWHWLGPRGHKGYAIYRSETSSLLPWPLIILLLKVPFHLFHCPFSWGRSSAQLQGTCFVCRKAQVQSLIFSDLGETLLVVLAQESYNCVKKHICTIVWFGWVGAGTCISPWRQNFPPCW